MGDHLKNEHAPRPPWNAARAAEEGWAIWFPGSDNGRPSIVTTDVTLNRYNMGDLTAFVRLRAAEGSAYHRHACDLINLSWTSTPKACRVCGCTETTACKTPEGACRWIAADLCSNPACVERATGWTRITAEGGIAGLMIPGAALGAMFMGAPAEISLGAVFPPRLTGRYCETCEGPILNDRMTGDRCLCTVRAGTIPDRFGAETAPHDGTVIKVWERRVDGVFSVPVATFPDGSVAARWVELPSGEGKVALGWWVWDVTRDCEVGPYADSRFEAWTPYPARSAIETVHPSKRMPPARPLHSDTPKAG